MIKKILEIKDFAVFKDFEWNKHVIDSQGKNHCRRKAYLRCRCNPSQG